MEVKIKDNSEEVLSAVEQAMINALHRIGARARKALQKNLHRLIQAACVIA